MKDKLPRFLLPSTDMKKAIDRNAKKDSDLSLLLDQLDKEKKVALEQLAKRQEAFQKEIIKRNENSNKFKFHHGDQSFGLDREDPRLEANRCCRRERLRRASSFEGTRDSSIVPLPPVVNKRYSLPASPIPRNSDAEMHHCSFKTGSDTTAPRRTLDTLKKDLNEQQQEEDKATIITENRFEGSPAPKLANYPSTKSLESKPQNVARRHSTAPATAAADETDPRLFRQRRRITLHNLLTPIADMNS